MSKRITNGIGLRAKLEAAGIGLNSSGSYVLRSFDPDEFDRVQKTDFQKLKFSDEDYVVIAHGTQGSLAKFAKVTADKKYARYFGGKYVSVALIQGAVFSKSDFIRSIAQNPALRVLHVSSAKQYVGILHGKMDAAYKSLVHPVPNAFLLLDLEENPPPQSSHMKVCILTNEPPEGTAVRASLLKLFA
jgi:hypothetical protein